MLHSDSTIWAVTAYFNPASFARRLENYRAFRERLNVPLVTVELSFERKFMLEPKDAEILIQLSGGDVLWQRERMFNIAVRSLPASCRHVVCVDCDVIFARDDWAKEVADVLEHKPMMQPFRAVRHLYPNAAPAADQTFASLESLAAKVAAGSPAAECLSWAVNKRQMPVVPGGSWAFRRDVLERHGLYDACIVGGGDLALMGAAYGCFSQAADMLALSPRHRAHYLKWAEPFFHAVNGAVGVANVDLYHLWHGRLDNRRYGQRHHALRNFDFDPATDLELDPQGAWRWKSAKADLHRFLQDYFTAREEDYLPVRPKN